MTNRAHNLEQVVDGAGVVFQNTQDSSRAQRLKFPVLTLEKVKRQREEHRALLKTLFPSPVRLHRLVQDIEKNFAKEVASIIGSVDFAEQRLAGLLSALKEIIEKIELSHAVSPEVIREHIREDHRIHEIFEDLVFECARFSLEEVENT